MSNYQDSLFSEEEITGQKNLFSNTENDDFPKASEPIICLGMTFVNDDERRKYFREELRKKLPELRHIEGFPIGSDDDIIKLSDPPYYTACPNPWLNDFIAQWEEEKKQLEAEGKRSADFEVTEPYASDVSEGKNNPIYMAHAYHTKVPHPAIMRYILHYTQPGDIVFDGFCGTGMTGVAAQLCGSRSDVANLNEKNVTVGVRHAICSDLSPFASLIAANYNLKFDFTSFIKKASSILDDVEKECGWMYRTKVNNKTATVNYWIWSDVYVCPNCGEELVLWDNAFDPKLNKINDSFNCPKCNHLCSKKNMNNCVEAYYDKVLGEVIERYKTVPVAVNFSTASNRGEIEPSMVDYGILEKIETETIDDVYALRLPLGSEAQRNTDRGISYTHQFFTLRNYICLCHIHRKISNNPLLFAWFTSCLLNVSKMWKFKPDRKGGALNGTYYVPSLNIEQNPLSVLRRKIRAFEIANYMQRGNDLISISSASDLSIDRNSIDYIFTDPPFGANIMYSELNALWENWLNIRTDCDKEAIVDTNAQQKTVFDYQNLMYQCLNEYFRILKPGKWMTLEFSNTSASIWNTIQSALQSVGFVIANVAALDKQQGSFKAVTTTTAVKQDLVITCYKPSDELTEKFKTSEDLAMNVWDFVEELLCHLPVHLQKGNKTTAVVERSPKILFDRVISYYVQHGYPVPMNAADFQRGLRERFVERDGMFFTAEQSLEYDTKRSQTECYEAAQSLFVGSESEGIEWLKRELDDPKTYQELQPEWMQALVQTKKGDNLPELKQILEENFLKDDDGRWYKPDPEKEADLEKVRARELARNFKAYVEMASTLKGRIKEARLEALRYGFRECYKEKDFATIVKVAQRLPEALVMEDDVLLQFYDIAINRL